MQMVKTSSKEKTLSRKLQELFLTWYLETYLTDDVEMPRPWARACRPISTG